MPVGASQGVSLIAPLPLAQNCPGNIHVCDLEELSAFSFAKELKHSLLSEQCSKKHH